MNNRKLHAGDAQMPELPMETTYFPTNKEAIDKRIASINPIAYAKTRNFINGAVTYLSPYLSRGFISLPQVKAQILQNNTKWQAEKLLQELAWREYFQRVWQHLGNGILNDIKQPQAKVANRFIPIAIINHQTQILGIDNGINNLYKTGYMHNHVRMYTAMLTCNIAQSHWLLPAKWMYYHLLDGDPASNMLSWQWVAGSFSSKKYYANQENIEKYTGTKQQPSYLNSSYEAIAEMPIPNALAAISELNLTTQLPTTTALNLNPELPLLVYNSFHTNPNWKTSEKANRVLLLEPDHFAKFAVSEKVLNFIIDLAVKNIPDIQIFCGSFTALEKLYFDLNNKGKIYFLEHPTTQHYRGIKEEREWLFPQVSGYFPSFFSYWKKCEKWL
ncbi:MAG: FAD-binding domain-containing protein [Chitinophagaceae bacterium]